MDIGMDQMDGIEVTRRVKAFYPDIKFIMQIALDDQKRFEATREGALGQSYKDALVQNLGNAMNLSITNIQSS